MTTYTIYGATTDGRIQSSSTTYSTALSGSSLSVATTGTTELLGQWLNGSTYQLYEHFHVFDCSGIDAGETVDSAFLNLYTTSDFSDTDFNAEARTFDWGASVDSTDWRTDSQLGSLTLLGLLSSVGVSTFAYNTFTDVAMAALVDGKSSTTRMVVASDRQRTASTPSGLEILEFRMADQTGTTQDPYLDVTATAPAGANDNATGRLLYGLTTSHLLTGKLLS